MVQAILNQAIQEKRKTLLLQVSQGSKRFGGKRVLTEIDREVAEYGLVVVVRRSGCGDATPSNLSCVLLDPQSRCPCKKSKKMASGA
jgi:ABC-type taurine transport system ATPase subunit